MDQKNNPESEIVRAHIWVKGRVQGVGFRAHVEYAARQIGGLTGWVRNVGYDTVEFVAEGERRQSGASDRSDQTGPTRLTGGRVNRGVGNTDRGIPRVWREAKSLTFQRSNV